MTSAAGEPGEPSSPPRTARPTLRDRLGRRPLGAELWAGLILLGGYAVAAVSALLVFGNGINGFTPNPAWVPPTPFAPLHPPSLAHPFGVLPGFGVDLFTVLWQATPWDVGIVAGILAIDVTLGVLLGTLAGMHEGGWFDAAVVFVADTLAAIPSFILIVGVFAGFAALAPRWVNLASFVLVFGLLSWPATARAVRERARQVARQPYLESAWAAGATRTRVYTRHLLPNSLTPLFARIPIDLLPIFFVLTVFPWFWNCAAPYNEPPGHPPWLVPTLVPSSPLPSVNFPEWGNLLSIGVCEGFPFLTGDVYWWMVLFPLAAIVGLAAGIALVCDGLEKRMNRGFT